MFTSEIRVAGKYIGGTIKTKNDKYIFFSELSFKNNEWTEDMLFDLAHELKEVERKIDSLNKPVTATR